MIGLRETKIAKTAFGVLVTLGLAGMPAFAATCEEELPQIQAAIDAMPDDADKQVAEKQYGKAQERLSSGNEKACLKYLESARSAIEAEQMHDNN